jgi:hypothetical protein
MHTCFYVRTNYVCRHLYIRRPMYACKCIYICMWCMYICILVCMYVVYVSLYIPCFVQAHSVNYRNDRFRRRNKSTSLICDLCKILTFFPGSEILEIHVLWISHWMIAFSNIHLFCFAAIKAGIIHTFYGVHSDRSTGKNNLDREHGLRIQSRFYYKKFVMTY